MCIFGWGHVFTKNFGVIETVVCSHCNNYVDIQLVRKRIWFSLCFIPVFPYFSKYYLVCPICQYGIEIRYKDIKNYKEKIQVTNLVKREPTNEIKVCQNCKKQYLSYRVTCPYCGNVKLQNWNTVNRITCWNCKKEYFSYYDKCPYCGSFNKERMLIKK